MLKVEVNIFPTAHATKEALPDIDDYKLYLISTAIFLVPFLRCLTYWSLNAEWCSAASETNVLQQQVNEQHVWLMKLVVWCSVRWRLAVPVNYCVVSADSI